MANPIISVVTVTRNLIEAGREEAFKKAVQCVQDQTCRDLEHIIWDGASDDGTQEMITKVISDWRSRENPVPFLFESNPDIGLYDAMNKAVEFARGDYVLFLNSDDLLASDRSLECIPRVGNHSQSPDFVFGATIQQSPAGGPSKTSRPDLSSVLQRMPFSHNSVLIKKSVFQNLGGHDLQYQVAADYDLVLRMIAAGYTGQITRTAISLYRLRGISSDDARVARDYASIWLRFFSAMDAQVGQYTHDDAVGWYQSGHFPLRLCLLLLKSKEVTGKVRRAAYQSLFKSLRRQMQPWSKFGT